MLGLVLWCDRSARHALIWCEDHGDLAVYDGRDGTGQATPLCTGDLVHVGLASARGSRRARTLRVVARGIHADLPQRLTRAASG